MTKAQKQKAALAQQRLEAMRAAGMEVPMGGGEVTKKKRPDYGNRKNKGRGKSSGDNDAEEQEEVKEEAAKGQAPQRATAEAGSSLTQTTAAYITTTPSRGACGGKSRKGSSRPR